MEFARTRTHRKIYLVSALLACAASAEAAEEAANTTAGSSNIDEVIVTGYRGSLASALEEKREQSGVVDVIKAEDVAKFPDANFAALARCCSGSRWRRGPQHLRSRTGP